VLGWKIGVTIGAQLLQSIKGDYSLETTVIQGFKERPHLSITLGMAGLPEEEES
jgi:hypothetical protein